MSGKKEGCCYNTKPKYVLAKVLKPTYNEKENKLLIPLVALPDTMMMEATICHYLLKYGYKMKEIRELRNIPNSWTKEKIENHIQEYGEVEYPENWYRR